MTTTHEKLVESLYAAAAYVLTTVTAPDVIETAPLNQRVDALNAVGRMLHRLQTVKTEKTEKTFGILPNPEIVWDYGREYDARLVADRNTTVTDALEALDADAEAFADSGVQELNLEELAAGAVYLKRRARVLYDLFPDRAYTLKTAAEALGSIALIFARFTSAA